MDENHPQFGQQPEPAEGYGSESGSGNSDRPEDTLIVPASPESSSIEPDSIGSDSATLLPTNSDASDSAASDFDVSEKSDSADTEQRQGQRRVRQRRVRQRRVEHRRSDLEDHDEWLELLIENATEYAIFSTDLGGIIQTWNPGAERVFRYREDEAIGSPVHIIFTPEDRAAGVPEGEMEMALETGCARDERWHVRKDGSLFYASGTVTPLRDPSGKIHGFAKIARDLTERKQAEEALKRANEALRMAHEEMETRVQERTSQLESANAEFAATNEELILSNAKLATSGDARRVLLRRLVNSQEEERARTSRELHDQMGQSLTALSLGLSNLRNQFPEAASESLDKLIHLSRDISDQVHRVAFSLLPPALEDLGLCAALSNYAHQWSGWSGIPLELECAINKEQRLPFEMEATIYRVVQEALTNVMRHAAEATAVSVVVHRTATHVITVIEDNGPGFDAEAITELPLAEKRLGLTGMEERAALAGGSLVIESTPGIGTSVLMRLPTG